MLMAHNAGFDVSLLAKALRRADKTSTALIKDARVLGIVDTLTVCRAINWDSSIEEAQAYLRDVDDRHLGSSVSEVAAHVLSAYRAAAADAAKPRGVAVERPGELCTKANATRARRPPVPPTERRTPWAQLREHGAGIHAVRYIK
jgi:hypothetical protein